MSSLVRGKGSYGILRAVLLVFAMVKSWVRITRVGPGRDKTEGDFVRERRKKRGEKKREKRENAKKKQEGKNEQVLVFFALRVLLYNENAQTICHAQRDTLSELVMSDRRRVVVALHQSTRLLGFPVSLVRHCASGALINLHTHIRFIKNYTQNTIFTIHDDGELNWFCCC